MGAGSFFNPPTQENDINVQSTFSETQEDSTDDVVISETEQDELLTCWVRGKGRGAGKPVSTCSAD